MIKLVTSTPEENPRMEAVLKSIDSLRAAIASGEMKAFCAVAIAPDMSVAAWQGCTQPTKYLEMLGAVSRLQMMVHEDIDG
jgi:hypothetical protein